jgi:hypothetical protein
MAPETFGKRFLMEFRRLGGTTQNWPDRAVTLLEHADRRQFIDALKTGSSKTAAALGIAAHTDEPERLARRAVEFEKQKNASADLLSVLTAIATNSS